MHEPMTLEAWQQAQAKTEAEEAADRAVFVEWLAGQSEAFRALASELFAMQEARRMAHGFDPSIRTSKDGRPIFVIRCPNGHHESFESHERALSLLVDSFRTRVEDLESTHERVGRTLSMTRDGRARLDAARWELIQRRKAGRGPPLDAVESERVARLMASREQCADLGRRIKNENPAMPGPERDELVLAAIDDIVAGADREEAEDRRAAQARERTERGPTNG